MNRQIVTLTPIALLMAALSHGQVSVCDLFKDLKAADGRQLIITGELLISKHLAALGAADCDNEYLALLQIWPTALHLRPSSAVPPEQLQLLQKAVTEADRLRRAGKSISASGSFAGRLRVATVDDFPAELTFDSVADLKIEALANSSELPVIPICELFQNLAAWKGKRIAVRGESSSSSEGSWISGRCKGSFYTNGYRWPVVVNYGGPAYYSPQTAVLSQVKTPSGPPKGEELFKGRNNVIRTATFIGRLRMRSDYMAVCREYGDWMTNGFGHLNGATAELIVEEVRDVELTRWVSVDGGDDTASERCKPANFAALCAAASLSRAASLQCVERVRELLSKEGIDSKDGAESASLSAAVRAGNETIVKLLIDSGAPVNPLKTRLWPPLAEAAHAGKIGIMKVLLKAGANVDGRDHDGATYLASYGCFDERATRVLLEAAADPNARDHRGATALMKASGYGYENEVKLLIEHGADVNLKDIGGRSALMHAAAGKYVDAIPYLLEHGADVFARDRDGNTALDIARVSKNQVAAELLSTAMKVGR